MKNVQVLKSNSVYRVADIVFQRGIRWEKDRASILGDASYGQTILYDYLSRLRFEKDWETLQVVINSHRVRYESPEEDELVIHLRLGDIMEDSDEFKSRNYSIYKDVYNDLKLPESIAHLRKATIVTALHFGANELNGRYFYSELAHDRSLQIIRSTCERLEENGLKVEIKSSENVDEDICYMAGSRYFVKSYSALADIVERVLESTAQVFSPQSLVL